MQTAAEYLTPETASADPQLRLMAAEMMLRSGRTDEGLALVRRQLEEDPSRREDIAAVGWKIAEGNAEAGFRLVELAADVSVSQTDWAAAAAALQEFVTRVPNHIPALMRLVEICVDGGLEATMYSAQAQLADAYIAAGAAGEARFIAEDLVAREPWERANIERFRRALVLLGEPDPDGVIAERLSGQTPFVSTDLVGEEELFGFDLPDGGLSTDITAALSPAEEVPAAAAAAPSSIAPPPEAAAAEPESTDIDSILGGLGILGDAGPGEPALHAAGERPGLGPSGLDDVFARLRDDASRRPMPEAPGDQLSLGLELQKAGRIDEALRAFETASQSPQHRFQACALLGRIYRERSMLPQAVEWFERAAEAPLPTGDEGHTLLYDLADALEQAGETARALAVCLELQADAGAFRDVAERVDRLVRVQTRG
jgi:tetratricopeptide (TPR) repeat protein